MSQKENIIKFTLSNWLGLLENLAIKKAAYNVDLDYNLKNFFTLSYEEKIWGNQLIDEINNIDEFTNKALSILRQNKSYNKINELLDEMSDKELNRGRDLNKCRSIKELSKELEELYKEVIEIKFDKSINEYVGY